MRSIFHPAFKRRRIREFYAWLAESTEAHSEWTMMNYGYTWRPEIDGPPPADLPALIAERLAAQMYWRVATLDGPLEGKDVLEVGSGRGGGAGFLFPRLRPRSYTGAELIPAAVEIAQRNHGRPGLSFIIGDAERLPFSEPMFDAVINVESSHAYGSSARFFAEVARVLRPGGALLFCDFRPMEELVELKEEMEAAGLVIEHGEDITPQMMTALDARAADMSAVLQRAPADKRDELRAFCMMPGTLPYQRFQHKESMYVLTRARRPG